MTRLRSIFTRNYTQRRKNSPKSPKICITMSTAATISICTNTLKSTQKSTHTVRCTNTCTNTTTTTTTAITTTTQRITNTEKVMNIKVTANINIIKNFTILQKLEAQQISLFNIYILLSRIQQFCNSFKLRQSEIGFSYKRLRGP